jgi:hypothetical protein
VIFQSEEERDAAYLSTFTGIDGTKVLLDLVSKVGLYRRTFNADPYVNAFNDGMKDLVVSIRNSMERASTRPAVSDTKPEPEAVPPYFQESEPSGE